MKLQSPFYQLYLAAVTTLAVGCATAPPGSPGGPPPAWTQQPTRTVKNGYIIYVGTGEDASADRAHFKASGMAIQDLVNECSLPPKGARTEESFILKDETSRVSKVWVKVAVQYEDCEAAKKAVQPDDIRKIANAQLAEELKRYQQMIDEPGPDEELASSDQEGLNPALGGTSGNPPSASSSGPRVVVVRDSGSFFWARQQVAYYKQVVILAPPQQYQPGSPQTVAFVLRVQPAQVSVQQYEAKNPEIKTWHQSYSASPVRQQMIARRAASRAAVAPARPNRSVIRGANRGARGQNAGGGVPRKRKRWPR